MRPRSRREKRIPKPSLFVEVGQFSGSLVEANFSIDDVIGDYDGTVTLTIAEYKLVGTRKITSTIKRDIGELVPA